MDAPWWAKLLGGLAVLAFVYVVVIFLIAITRLVL